MAKHEFGGPWTEDKLERVRKYLCAYTTIFRGNPRARKLRTTYVDAFAGTGSVAPCACESEEASLFDVSGDGDAAAIKKGSARIALEVEPSFDHYLFIERNRERIEDLEGLRQEFPTKAARVEVIAGDANQELSDWCDRTDWARSRAVVFLDPYGMQVCWTLIARIAETRAVDLWLLFPLGVAVNRLLTRSRLPTQAWGDALTRILGTEEWRGLDPR